MVCGFHLHQAGSILVDGKVSWLFVGVAECVGARDRDAIRQIIYAFLPPPRNDHLHVFFFEPQIKVPCKPLVVELLGSVPLIA